MTYSTHNCFVYLLSCSVETAPIDCVKCPLVVKKVTSARYERERRGKYMASDDRARIKDKTNKTVG